MVWKSRVGAYPKQDFLARLLAHLRLAYPDAELTESVLRELWPFIVQEWRHGKDERGVATSTCSCDGVRIVPSPAVQVALANRRIVRAPKDAQPNQVFGVTSLRASSRIERLQLAMHIVQRKLQLKEEALLALAAKLPSVRSESQKHALARRQSELGAEKQALGADLERMQKEYAETIRGVERIIEPLRTAVVARKSSSGKSVSKANVPDKKTHDAKPKTKTASSSKEATEGCACHEPGGDAAIDVTEQDLTGLLNNLAGGLDLRDMAGLTKTEGA